MLRASLRLSSFEGICAELVGACAGGGVLTAWALWLRLPPVLIGLLAALPAAAQTAQLPAAWLTRRLGARRAALWAIGVSRQLILPLALLPWAPLGVRGRAVVFLSVACCGALLSIVGNNAWTTWMGDLVPPGVRGRYFGRRTALCALADAVGAVLAGLALDAGRRTGHEGLVLSLLALAASAAGAASILLLLRQHDPRLAAPIPPTLREAFAPFGQRGARRLIAFQAAWCAASGLAAAFYPLHMVDSLHLGFTRVALYNATLSAASMALSPLWGRAMDRLGARPVLAACAFALCASPFLWLFAEPGHLWPLALDALLCGAASAGFALASFSLPLALAPPSERAFLLAAVSGVGGVATALASALGGALLHALPVQVVWSGRIVFGTQLLFLLGGLARAGAAVLALRLEERGAGTVVALGRLALGRVRRPVFSRRPDRAKLAA